MIKGEPRVLLFDLETAPNLAYVWGTYEQNVIQFKKEWSILSIAWKWIGDDKAQCLAVCDFKCKDDKELVKHIHSLFQEADIICAHNGNAFDIKKAKARFIYHNLKPTKILSTIDTKLVAKRYFAFNSNSLNDLGKHLGLGQKTKHEGFDLWLKCMNNDAVAWKKMKTYNIQDVELLHKIYERFKPWIQNHPSLARLKEHDGCPNCGSSNVMRRGVRANNSGLRQQMSCTDCGGWYLTRYSKPR